MGAVKNVLKKILPPPVNSFMREVNRIVALEKKNQKAIDKLIEIVGQQAELINAQSKVLQYQERQLQSLQNVLQEQERKQLDSMHVLSEEQQLCITKLQNDVMQSKQEQLAAMIEADNAQRSAIANIQNEIIRGYQEQLVLIKAVSEAHDKYVESSVMKAESQMKAIEHLKQQQEIIKADAKAARNHAWNSQKNSDEILWAEIFHDASSNSTWLHDKAFSAGRWAVGYQYLYAVYRILDEVKPKNILELGLGQSTRLLGQYASANSDVTHMVVEHDPSWIEFFQQDFTLEDNTNIVQLEREYIKFCEDEKVLAFKDFYDTFEGQKFDFISIDAPYGGDAIVYARVDILNLLPECLAESFVIVIDDYNRKGEQNMVKILEMILTDKDISYVKGVYSGQKDCVVISSDDFKFVCSL